MPAPHAWQSTSSKLVGFGFMWAISSWYLSNYAVQRLLGTSYTQNETKALGRRDTSVLLRRNYRAVCLCPACTLCQYFCAILENQKQTKRVTRIKTNRQLDDAGGDSMAQAPGVAKALKWNRGPYYQTSRSSGSAPAMIPAGDDVRLQE